jgi:hypothetical protein
MAELENTQSGPQHDLLAPHLPQAVQVNRGSMSRVSPAVGAEGDGMAATIVGAID